MIDLHTHILPGMDDGSPDAETSLALLRRQAEEGVTAVCASSHFYCWRDSVESFCARRALALEKLGEKLDGRLPRVIPAAEAAFFSGISECEGLERLCIAGTRTLLLEMPFSDWTGPEEAEVEALVLDRGFRVALVHPERFCSGRTNREILRRLNRLPVGFQINAGALLRWRTRRLALELLEEAALPLLASDCHNLDSRPPNLAAGRKLAARRLGSAFLEELDRNAAAFTGLRFERAPRETTGETSR